jgi:hypothetical protein
MGSEYLSTPEKYLGHVVSLKQAKDETAFV